RAKVRLHKTEIRQVNIPDRTSRTGAGKRKVPAVLVRTAAPRIAVDRSAAVLRAPQRAAAQAAERFGQWSLEQPEDFVFALSFKRSILSDDRTAAAQLAFVCNQEKKDVAILLLPLDGTFTSRHEAIPVAVQKIEEQSDQSDLMQRWENGPGYI